MSDNFILGYDYNLYLNHQIQIKIRAPIGHTIVVGGSGSGKSTAVLYWLYKMKKEHKNIELYIMDFKGSHEFVGITDNYAEFEDIYDKLVEFYDMFCTLQEGGDGTVKILIIDEIAGFLTHLSMTKEGKEKADKIMPPMDSSDAAKELLDSTFKGGISEEVELPEEALQFLNMYFEGQAEAEVAKEKVQLATNNLKQYLKDNNVAVLNGHKISWKPICSERLDSKKLKEEQPEIYKQYVKVSESRRFTVK